MLSLKQQLIKFSTATLVLLIGSIVAAVSYWYAHVETDIRFTLLGFFAAVMSGMYYGLQVPNRGSNVQKQTKHHTA